MDDTTGLRNIGDGQDGGVDSDKIEVLNPSVSAASFSLQSFPSNLAKDVIVNGSVDIPFESMLIGPVAVPLCVYLASSCAFVFCSHIS